MAAVEADVALAVTVLRLANRVDGRMRGRVESAVKGVEVLSPYPSASACMRWPRSVPPIASPVSSAMRPATG